MGKVKALLVAAVVLMVRVAVPAVVPVMLTGLVVPKVRVGGYWLPVGLDVIVAVSVTLPVKPLLGERVMVEVLPVAAPGVTVTAVPLKVKLGGGRLMVYCAVASADCAYPVAVAMAWMVSDEETGMGSEYIVELAVGVFPFVV